MMNTLDQIQAPIQAELRTFREQFAHTLQSDNQLLQLALDHILKRTGKMVRPTMVLLSARMAGGVNQQVMDVALALELLHTASLVHDDVVDGLFNDCKAALIGLIKSPNADGEAMVDLMMISKYYERIGDHAVNIAKWVLFSITGTIGEV